MQELRRWVKAAGEGVVENVWHQKDETGRRVTGSTGWESRGQHEGRGNAKLNKRIRKHIM